MNITIVGAGNAGLIHAAKLIKKGYDVSILKTSNIIRTDFFKRITQEGGYHVVDAYKKGSDDEKYYTVKPKLITYNVEEAIRGAELIFIMTTVTQHESVAKLIAPYVEDGQTICICPSYMSRFIFEKHIKKEVTYCEFETTVYNGRIVNDEYVNITFYNPRNAFSVYPHNKEQYCIDLLSKCFSNAKYLRNNSVESALHNPNMIVHTIGTVLSASRIEYSKGEFWMYKEAFTPSVIKVINSFDKEKNEILSAVNCPSLSYFEAAKWRNTEDLTQDAMDVFKSFAESSNKGPSVLNQRYLTEDVPMGLVLFSSLGKLFQIDTPIADSIINLASALLGRNFWEEGRYITSLLDNNDLKQFDLLKLL